MKKLLISLLIGFCLMMSACNQTSPETPKVTQPKDSSSLGETPTLTGRIANFEFLGLDSSSLTVKAMVFSLDGTKSVELGSSAVSKLGGFSIILSQKQDLANLLFVQDPNASCNQNVVITPATFKGNSISLELSDQKGNSIRLLQTKMQDTQGLSSAYAFYFYADTKATMKGTQAADCLGLFESTEPFNVDISLEKGWNAVIASEDGSFKNVLPDASFIWYAAGNF